MTSSEVGRRRDRTHAFVPELIPEPVDLDRTGPLDAREQRDLERIHSARDNFHAAKWMRGKALEAAFRRQLFRGEDGSRTRQEYLDDEWDGISESAAYLEINEWPLAAEISQTYGRPAPDSHVRALVDVAKQHGLEQVALSYHELRQYGAERRLRVTANVVANLATYLSTGETPALQTLFAPPQLPSPSKPKDSTQPQGGALTGEVRTSTEVAGDASGASFQNFGIPKGRQSGEADGNGEVQAGGSDLLAEKAARASVELDGMRLGFLSGGLVQHASTDTLKAIVASARTIAAAAEEELKNR